MLRSLHRTTARHALKAFAIPAVVRPRIAPLQPPAVFQHTLSTSLSTNSTIMSHGNERFNEMAKAWDSNPDVHRASEDALKTLLHTVPALDAAKSHEGGLADGIDVLEIGCGTGLLTLILAPHVRRIVAVDAAQGMIDALNMKLEHTPMPGVTPLHSLLEDPEDPALPAADGADPADIKAPRRKFDLAISHLVLHHIPDHPALLRMFFGSLKSGGRIALTDFQDCGPESERFHPEDKMDGVEFRCGIHAETFAAQMREAGFVDVDVGPAWTLRKHVEKFPGQWKSGKPSDPAELEEMDFPFVLCQGRKP